MSPLAGVSLNSLSSDLLSAVIDADSMGNATIIPARLSITRVYQMIIVSAGALTVTIQDGSTPLTGAMSLITGQPLILPFSSQPWFSIAGAFTLALSAGTQVSGMVGYR